MNRVGVYVDGPNFFNMDGGGETDISLFVAAARSMGEPTISQCFLNQYASEQLIEAVTMNGYEPITVVGDVDVRMSVQLVQDALNDRYDTAVVVTRDLDFKHAVDAVRRAGKSVVLAGTNPDEIANPLLRLSERVCFIQDNDFELHDPTACITDRDTAQSEHDLHDTPYRPDERYAGRIIQMGDRFGFIRPDVVADADDEGDDEVDEDVDVWIGQSHVPDELTLSDSDRVSFRVVKTPDGLQAREIKPAPDRVG